MQQYKTHKKKHFVTLELKMHLNKYKIRQSDIKQLLLKQQTLDLTGGNIYYMST